MMPLPPSERDSEREREREAEEKEALDMVGKRRNQHRHGEAASSEYSSSKRHSNPFKHRHHRHGEETGAEKQEAWLIHEKIFSLF